MADSWLSFVVGILVSVIASIMNAVGLNLLNLDHVKNSERPVEDQRNECGRPLWHIGLYLYVLSQLFGSTIALYFLKAQWVAPLGSVALIFNFVFARVLVGTRIIKQDIIGTVVVIISVVWIVIFGGLGSDSSDDNLTLEKLKDLFTRSLFVAYFSVLEIITITWLGLALYGYYIVKDERRKRHHSFFKGIHTKRLKKFVGMTMAGVGGLIASQTLLLAKSGVKLFYNSITIENQFTDSLSWFILVGLVVTAIFQVYCLNTALKLHDSVLVVPIFFGFYTAMGLINSMIYLDELSKTPAWAIFVVMLGIGTLIYGVILLSESKEDLKDAEESEVTKDSIPLSPVLWNTANRRSGFNAEDLNGDDSNNDNNDNANGNNNHHNNNSPYRLSLTTRKRRNSTTIERGSLPPPLTPDIIIIDKQTSGSARPNMNNMLPDDMSIITLEDDDDDDEMSVSDARSYEDLLGAKYRSNS